MITPELLARLLDEHGAALELFAAQWTRAPEDCVQDAFLQLVRQSRMPDNLVAWLYRVVRNRAISLRRSADRRQKHEQRVALFRSNTNLAGDPLFDAEAVTGALERLRPKQREIIVARIWGGLSFEQLAVVLSISRSSAHRRYTEALDALRAALGVLWEMKNSTTN